MKNEDACPRCGAPVKSEKMGGLCWRYVSEALFGGGQEFDDDLVPIEQMEGQGNSPFAPENQPDNAVTVPLTKQCNSSG